MRGLFWTSVISLLAVTGFAKILFSLAEEFVKSLK